METASEADLPASFAGPRSASQLSEAYNSIGYVVVEDAIPEPHIALLREECAQAIERMHREMDRDGTDYVRGSYRNSRYFIPAFGQSKRVKDFLFSDVMAQICRATIGDTAYLRFEQFVVKAADGGMKFDWHQDSGYIRHDHAPFVTCWCALDDVSEANGTVYLLPYERAPSRLKIEHFQDAGGDMIGYIGPDPGELVCARAGAIAAFSSCVLHRSGANTTNRMRRIYLAQYSAQPIMNEDATAPLDLAEPFLVGGKSVR